MSDLVEMLCEFADAMSWWRLILVLIASLLIAFLIVDHIADPARSKAVVALLVMVGITLGLFWEWRAHATRNNHRD